jgi:farnesyl-diphosphate farnesyltransferase
MKLMDIFEILSRTSRSFSLGIMSLESPLKEQVCLGYLVCRIMDTYEDSTSLSSALRRGCLAYSEKLLALLPDAGEPFARELEAWDDVHAFSTEWTPERHPDDSEYELLRGGAAIWRHLGEMPPVARRAFRESLMDMASGMRAEVESRQIRRERRARELTGTDAYCYIVAGTVGRLLTALFRGEGAFADVKEGDVHLDREAVEFGKALQLVNVMKDFHKDWREGRCYWPGIELPAERDTPVPALPLLEASFRELHALFTRYRASAESYTQRLAMLERKDLHFFCAFPLRMAIATLEQADRDRDWLASGGTFKVGRAEVSRIMAALI